MQELVTSVSAKGKRRSDFLNDFRWNDPCNGKTDQNNDKKGSARKRKFIMAKKKFDIDQGFHQLDEILQSFQ